MKIGTIITLVVIALFILLPILHGDASFPKGISHDEIGSFLRGFFGYWIGVLKSALGFE